MERNIFEGMLSKIDVRLDDVKLDKLDSFHKILVEWNEFMNLTAITEYDDVLVKHFLDSLVLKYALNEAGISDKLNVDEGFSIIDVGTGAGFPGIPLKIAFDRLSVTLLDSLNKRVKFLNEVIRSLELDNITAIHDRAEEGARREQLREQFDVSVSRAVANLSTLSEYCIPFVRVGGYFVAYKAGQSDEEIETAKKAIKILGGQLEKVVKLTLPDTDIERTVVFIKKIESTKKKYPRKAGLPSREPL